MLSKPAHLKPFSIDGVEINPMVKALSKLETPQILFDQSLVDDVADRMVFQYVRKGWLKPYCKDVDGKLSEAEVICGVEGDDWIKPMNMASSPGYPYVLAGNKHMFIDYEGQSYRSVLRLAVSRREAAAREGCQLPAIIVDMLKDERLPNEKVDQGKVRIFNVCPLDYNCLVRKYFTRFLAQMMEHHLDGEVAVGVNPHDQAWGVLFQRIKTSGDHWIAGDYGAWDKRAPYQIAMAVLRIVEHFYSQFPDYDPADAEVRRVLIDQAYRSTRLVQCGGRALIYRVHQSMPSGIAVTAVYNSLVNSLLFRVIYAELAQAYGLSRVTAIASYDRSVAFSAYGDDHIARVGERAFSFFNMETIGRQMALHGIEYTNADKTTDVRREEEESNLYYLKRRFVHQYGRIDAPMDLPRIMDILNWVHVVYPDLEREASECALNSVLIELSHHKKEVYDREYIKLHAACLSVGLLLPPARYEDMVQLRLSQKCGYGEEFFDWL